MDRTERHFNASEWTDYVRKQVPPDQYREMLAHLDSGCSTCKKTEGLLSKFATVCAAEGAYAVPAHLERSAKALFALHKKPRVSRLAQLCGMLLYDSLASLQPAGVRSGHQISRHVLFQAGDYAVDLRFEHEKGSPSMVLVGQIANRKKPEEFVASVPVILLSGSQEVTRSFSNSFGEFQMEYAPNADLHLRVPLDAQGQELEVALSVPGHD